MSVNVSASGIFKERIVNVLFLTFVCGIFVYASIATRAYGQKLREIRQRCRNVIDEYNDTGIFPHKDYTYILIESDTTKLLHSNDADVDHNELVHLLKASESGKLVFHHAPDMHNTSHIIATYKEVEKEVTCLTFMNT